MAWDSGTITSASPWAQVSTKLKNLVGGSGVANWSFVENVPAGTSTGQSGSTAFSLDVFKCSGSGTDANDAATDWYFIIEIPVPDGAVTGNMMVMEDYEGSTNKRFRRPAALASSTAPTGTGYWRTDTLAAYTAVTGKVNMGGVALLNTTGFSYWLKLTKNGVFYTIKVGTNEYSLAGMLIDSITSVSDPCPLIFFVNGNFSSPSVWFTRLPSVTSMGGVSGWSAVFGDWTTNKHTSNFTATFTSQADSTTVDFWQGSKVHATRVGVLHGSTARNVAGGWRGIIKTDFLVINTGGTVAPGDTMTLGGNTWTVIATVTMGGSNAIWITRAN